MPTPEEIIVINQQISSAKMAYHRLMTGTAVKVVVDQNGERVEYAQANATKLLAYITSLEALISGRRTMGPMRVYF